MTDSNNPDAAETQNPSVIYDFDPRNLPPEFLRAVGLVAMASAQTEHVVETFIGCLAGVDNLETLAITAHMGGPLKDHVAGALIELNAVTAAIVDDVDDLLEAIEAALKKRNTLVHSPLMRHPDTGQVFSWRLKARGSLQLGLVPITVAEIEEDAAEIYEAGMALMQFQIDNRIMPRERRHPIREPLDRSKAARAARRASASTSK